MSRSGLLSAGSGGPVVRPEDFGAKADGTTNDDTAIIAAVNAVASVGRGTVLFTPGKTYAWGTGTVFVAKHNVTLWMHGATLKRLPGVVLQSGHDVGTFGNWQYCDDLRIIGGTLDCNNIERYGGFQINGCARPYVQGLRVIDSNLNASWASYDHYSFVFNSQVPNALAATTLGSNQLTSVVMGSGTFTNGETITGTGIPAGTTILSGAGTSTITMSANATATATNVQVSGSVVTRCSDVRMFDIHSSDVEMVEVDDVDGFQLSRFVSRRAAGTTAIGWFSVPNGVLLQDFEISHGIVIDPRKRGINITHETSGPNNNTLRRLKVKDVKVLKLTETGGVSSLVTFGNAGGSASSGNVYEDFAFEDILLYVDPGVTQMTKPLLSFNPTTGHDVKRAKLKNITIIGDASASEWAADIRQLNDAEIDNLKMRGAQRGLLLTAPQNSNFRNLDVAGSLAAYSLSGSRGGNRFSNAVVNGASTTPYALIAGAHATDSISGVPGAIPSVASTAALTLPPSGDIFTVTGTTAITSIVATGQVGRRVTLMFASTASLTSGSNLVLQGSFAGAAGKTIDLVCDGTNWTEVAPSFRQAIAGDTPWRVPVDVFAEPATQTSWSTLVDAAVIGGGRLDSTGAQNAQIGFDEVLGAGTWTVSLLHSKGADRGIYTVNIGGTDVGTIDGYNASTVGSSKTNLTGIVIAATGKVRILLTMATKNASSSSYFGRIQALSLVRTA